MLACFINKTLLVSDKSTMTLVGTLSVSGHDLRIYPATPKENGTPCAIAVVSPGIPRSFLNDISEQDLATTPHTAKLLQSLHKNLLLSGKSSLYAATAKGVLRVAPSYGSMSRARANGYGYRGALKLAIILESLELLEQSAKPDLGNRDPGHPDRN